jgi:hypothetical protein
MKHESDEKEGFGAFAFIAAIAVLVSLLGGLEPPNPGESGVNQNYAPGNAPYSFGIRRGE